MKDDRTGPMFDGNVANVRRMFWRLNPIKDVIDEATFVRDGYSPALMAKLGARGNVQTPKARAYQREPGEDAIESEATA